MRSWLRPVQATLLFCCTPLFGEEQILRHVQPRALVWSIFTSLYAQEGLSPEQKDHMAILTDGDWPSLDVMIDTLIYLESDEVAPDHPRALLAQGTLPRYSNEAAASLVVKFYAQQNPDRAAEIDAIKVEPIVLAGFLRAADRMDGDLDVSLELPRLEGLYHLAIERQVPTAAIGYNLRELDTWVDRRTIVDQNGLAELVPPKLRRLLRGKANHIKKLQGIQKFVSSAVTKSEDGYSNDYWQTPLETLEVGEGDCEDFAILFHTLADMAGINTSVAIGYTWTGVGANARMVDAHAWVIYDGQVLDPISPVDIGWRYEAHMVFNADSAVFVTPDADKTVSAWAVR